MAGAVPKEFFLSLIDIDYKHLINALGFLCRPFHISNAAPFGTTEVSP